MSVQQQQERYYTYVELRRMAKEQGLRLVTNISRSNLCNLLNIPLGDRGACFRGRMDSKPVKVLNIHNGESITFPSANHASLVLGVKGGGVTVRRRIYGRKTVVITDYRFYLPIKTYSNLINN